MLKQQMQEDVTPSAPLLSNASAQVNNHSVDLAKGIVEKSVSSEVTISKWHEAGETLNRWNKRAKIGQSAHYHHAKINERYSNVTALISTFFVSFVTGAVALSTLVENLGVYGKWFIGIVGLIAAVATAVQTQFKFSEKAQQHSNAAAAYGDIRKMIEEINAIPEAERRSVSETLKEVRKEFKDIPKQCPRAELPEKERYEIEFDDWAIFKNNTSQAESESQ